MQNRQTIDKPLMLVISKVVKEAANINTFYFDHPLNSQPGQFVMLWLPGVDQKPISVGYDDGKTFGLTICAVGNFSRKVNGLKAGDRVGISGPYGTSFTLKPNMRYILVAGGYGAAPLAFLAEEAAKLKNNKIDFLIGAKTSGDLLFEERLGKIKDLTLHCATDDGSRGHPGFITELLDGTILNQKSKIKNLKSKIVCTCGPELMQKKVLDICNKHDIDCEISIERYMKCGIGVCGQCAVDDLGICLCTRGPVVSKETANQIKEFGVYHRDKTGARVSFKQ